MTESIETSIHILMDVAREGMERVAGPLGRVGLVDDRFAGYDGWDRIAESIFEEVVAESIRWSLTDSEREAFQFPRYAFRYEDLNGFSFIKVKRAGEESDSTSVFVEFASRGGSYRFDHVIARKMQGAIMALDEILIPLDEVRYSVIHVVGSDSKEIEKIRIME